MTAYQTEQVKSFQGIECVPSLSCHRGKCFLKHGDCLQSRYIVFLTLFEREIQMVNLVITRRQADYCFSPADCNISNEGLESQKALRVLPLPGPRYIIFKHPILGIRIDLEKSDDAGEIGELVLDWSA